MSMQLMLNKTVLMLLPATSESENAVFVFFFQCWWCKSCCFLIVGWKGNSSGFYMEIAFHFHPLTSKYFTTFFFLFVPRQHTEMKSWIIIMCAIENQHCMMRCIQHRYFNRMLTDCKHGKISQNILFPFKSSIFQARSFLSRMRFTGNEIKQKRESSSRCNIQVC